MTLKDKKVHVGQENTVNPYIGIKTARFLIECSKIEQPFFKKYNLLKYVKEIVKNWK